MHFGRSFFFSSLCVIDVCVFARSKRNFNFNLANWWCCSVVCLMRLWGAFLWWKMTDSNDFWWLLFSPFAWNMHVCMWFLLTLCWFIRTATTLSTVIKLNHVHFVVHPFGFYLSFFFCWDCICASIMCIHKWNLFDWTFHLSFLGLISIHEAFLFLFGVVCSDLSKYTRASEHLSSSGKIIKPDQAHIRNICCSVLFHSIFERKLLIFMFALSADFDASECAINFRMCDIRIEQRIKSIWIKGPRFSSGFDVNQYVAHMRNYYV